jgi:hypothetical protein
MVVSHSAKATPPLEPPRADRGVIVAWVERLLAAFPEPPPLVPELYQRMLRDYVTASAPTESELEEALLFFLETGDAKPPSVTGVVEVLWRRGRSLRPGELERCAKVLAAGRTNLDDRISIRCALGIDLSIADEFAGDFISRCIDAAKTLRGERPEPPRAKPPAHSPPDLQALVGRFGTYDKITSEAWAEWDRLNADYQQRRRDRLGE